MKAFEILKFTRNIRYLLFPALYIIELAWQLRQSFSPALQIFLLASDNIIKLFSPALVIVRVAMMFEVSDHFIHVFSVRFLKCLLKTLKIYVYALL